MNIFSVEKVLVGYKKISRTPEILVGSQNTKMMAGHQNVTCYQHLLFHYHAHFRDIFYDIKMLAKLKHQIKPQFRTLDPSYTI